MDKIDLLSVTDLARLLGVKPNTVRRWHARGDLFDAYTLSGRLYWRREDLEQWLKEAKGPTRSTREAKPEATR